MFWYLICFLCMLGEKIHSGVYRPIFLACTGEYPSFHSNATIYFVHFRQSRFSESFCESINARVQRISSSDISWTLNIFI